MRQHSPYANDLPEGFSSSIKVQATPSGSDTVWLDNALIHSMYDPVKEGETFANKVAIGSQICLYGFGLGYHINSLLKRIGPDGFLLAIELNPDLLFAAMTLKDQSKILCYER